MDFFNNPFEKTLWDAILNGGEVPTFGASDGSYSDRIDQMLDKKSDIDDVIKYIYYTRSGNKRKPNGMKAQIQKAIRSILDDKSYDIQQVWDQILSAANGDAGYTKRNEDEYASTISKIQGALQRTVNQMYARSMDSAISQISRSGEQLSERATSALSGSRWMHRMDAHKGGAFKSLARAFRGIENTFFENDESYMSFLDDLEGMMKEEQEFLKDTTGMAEDEIKESREFLGRITSLHGKIKAVEKTYGKGVEKAFKQFQSVKKSLTSDVGTMSSRYTLSTLDSMLEQIEGASQSGAYGAQKRLDMILKAAGRKTNARGLFRNGGIASTGAYGERLRKIQMAADVRGFNTAVYQDANSGEYRVAFYEKGGDIKGVPPEKLPGFTFFSLNDPSGRRISRYGSSASNNLLMRPVMQHNSTTGKDESVVEFTTTVDYLLENVERAIQSISTEGGDFSAKYSRLAHSLRNAEERAFRGADVASTSFFEKENDFGSSQGKAINQSAKAFFAPVIESIISDLKASDKMDGRTAEHIYQDVFDEIGEYLTYRGKRGVKPGILRFPGEHVDGQDAEAYTTDVRPSFKTNREYLYTTNGQMRQMLESLSMLPFAPQYGSPAQRNNAFLQLIANVQRGASYIYGDTSRHLSQVGQYDELTEEAAQQRAGRKSPMIRTVAGESVGYNYDAAPEKLYNVMYVSQKELSDTWQQWIKTPEGSKYADMILPGLHDSGSIFNEGIRPEFNTHRERNKNFDFNQWGDAIQYLAETRSGFENMSNEQRMAAVVSYLTGVDEKDISGLHVGRIDSGYNISFDEHVGWSHPKFLGQETGTRSEGASLPAEFFNSNEFKRAFGNGVDFLRLREKIKSNDFGGMLVGALQYQLLHEMIDAKDVADMFKNTPLEGVFQADGDTIRVVKSPSSNIEISDNFANLLNRMLFGNGRSFGISEGVMPFGDYEWRRDVKYGQRELEAAKRAALSIVHPDTPEDIINGVQEILSREDRLMHSAATASAKIAHDKYERAYMASFGSGDEIVAEDVKIGGRQNNGGGLEYVGSYLTPASYAESAIGRFYNSLSHDADYARIVLGDALGYTVKNEKKGQQMTARSIYIPTEYAPKEEFSLEDDEQSLGYRLTSFDLELNKVLSSLEEYNSVINDSTKTEEEKQEAVSKIVPVVNDFMKFYPTYYRGKENQISSDMYTRRIPGAKAFEGSAIFADQTGKVAEKLGEMLDTSFFVSRDAMSELIGNNKNDVLAAYKSIGLTKYKGKTVDKLKEEILDALTVDSPEFKNAQKGLLTKLSRYPSIQGQDTRYVRGYISSNAGDSVMLGLGLAPSVRGDFDRDHFELLSFFRDVGQVANIESYIRGLEAVADVHARVSQKIATKRRASGYYDSPESPLEAGTSITPPEVSQLAAFAGLSNRGNIGLISSQATAMRNFLMMHNADEKSSEKSPALSGQGQMLRYLFEAIEQDAISYKHVIDRIGKPEDQISEEEYADERRKLIGELSSITAQAWKKENGGMKLVDYLDQIAGIGVFKDNLEGSAVMEMAIQASQSGGKDFRDKLLSTAAAMKRSGRLKDERTPEQIVSDFLMENDKDAGRDTWGTIPYALMREIADQMDVAFTENGTRLLARALTSQYRTQGDPSFGEYAVYSYLKEHGVLPDARTDAERARDQKKEEFLKRKPQTEFERSVQQHARWLNGSDWDAVFAAIAATDDASKADIMQRINGYALRVDATQTAGSSGRPLDFEMLGARLDRNGHKYTLVDSDGHDIPGDVITASRLGSMARNMSFDPREGQLLQFLDKYEGTNFSAKDIWGDAYTSKDIADFNKLRRAAIASMFGTLQHEQMELMGDLTTFSADEFEKRVLSDKSYQETLALTKSRLKKLGYEDTKDNPEIARFLAAAEFSTRSQMEIASRMIGEGGRVVGREFSLGLKMPGPASDRLFGGTFDQLLLNENGELVIADMKNKTGNDPLSQLLQLSIGKYLLEGVKKEYSEADTEEKRKKIQEKYGLSNDFLNALLEHNISSTGLISKFNPALKYTTALDVPLMSKQEMEGFLSELGISTEGISDEYIKRLLGSHLITENLLAGHITPGEASSLMVDKFATPKLTKEVKEVRNALYRKAFLETKLSEMRARGQTESTGYAIYDNELNSIMTSGLLDQDESGAYTHVGTLDSGVDGKTGQEFLQDEARIINSNTEAAKNRIEQEQKLREQQQKEIEAARLKQQRAQQIGTKEWLAQDIKSGPANAFRLLFYGGVTTRMILKGVQQIKQLIKITEQLNASMTNLRIVTGKDAEEAKSMMKSYNDLAKQLGTTTAAVAQAGTEWLRQGYNIQETQKLIEASTKLAKLGFMDQGAAVKSLTAAMKGFNIEATDSMSIVDKLTTLDSKYATTAGDIATALTRVAAVANSAGMSLDQTAAAITAIIDKTQQDAGTVGYAMKTMLSRYGNVKAGSFAALEGDEEGDTENINDVERVLGAIGIKIRSSKMEMRDFGDVLDDIAEKWTTLTNVEQNAIAVALGGVRQRNTTVALLESYGTYKQALEDEEQSEGRADRKYEAYQDSIEYQKQELQAAWEGLVLKIDESEVIKGLLEFATKIVTDMDKFFPALIDGIFLAMSVFKSFGVQSTTLKSAIRSNTAAVNRLSSAITGNPGGTGTGDDPDHPEKTGFKGWAKKAFLGEGTKKERVGRVLKNGLSQAAFHGASSFMTGGGVVGNLIDDKAGTTGFETTKDNVISGVAGLAGSAVGAIGYLGGPILGALTTAIGGAAGDAVGSLIKYNRHKDEIFLDKRVKANKKILEGMQSIKGATTNLGDAFQKGMETWSSADYKKNSELLQQLKAMYIQNESFRKVVQEKYDQDGKKDVFLTSTLSDLSKNFSKFQAVQIIEEAKAAFAANEAELSSASNTISQNRLLRGLYGRFLDSSGNIDKSVVTSFQNALAGTIDDNFSEYEIKTLREKLDGYYTSKTESYGSGPVQTTYTVDSESLQVFLNSAISKMEDDIKYNEEQLRLYVDQKNSEFLKAAIYTSGLYDMSDVQIKNMTIDEAVRKVALAWQDVGTADVYLGGEINRNRRQEIIDYFLSDDKYKGIINNDVLTYGELLFNQEKAISVINSNKNTKGKTIKDVINDLNLDERQLTSSYSDADAHTVYMADEASLLRIAHGLNMTADEAKKAGDAISWVTSSDIANGISGLVEKFDKLSSILSDVASTGAISASNMSNILKNYSFLLGSGENMGPENVIGNIVGLLTGKDSLDVFAGLISSGSQTDTDVWGAFKKEYYDRFSSFGLTNDEIKKINASSTWSAAKDVMLSNQQLQSSWASVVAKYIGDLGIFDKLREILVKAASQTYQNDIDNLTSIKESLEDVNKLREKEINLIKARIALENAQNEKKRVYREGVGFVYASDQQAIQKAQEDLDKLEREKSQSDIQYQIDMLSQQKNILDNIKNNEELESISDILDTFMTDTYTNGLSSLVNAITGLDKSEFQKILSNKVEGSVSDNTSGVEGEADTSAIDEYVKHVYGNDAKYNKETGEITGGEYVSIDEWAKDNKDFKDTKGNYILGNPNHPQYFSALDKYRGEYEQRQALRANAVSAGFSAQEPDIGNERKTPLNAGTKGVVLSYSGQGHNYDATDIVVNDNIAYDSIASIPYHDQMWDSKNGDKGPWQNYIAVLHNNEWLKMTGSGSDRQISVDGTNYSPLDANFDSVPNDSYIFNDYAYMYGVYKDANGKYYTLYRPDKDGSSLLFYDKKSNIHIDGDDTTAAGYYEQKNASGSLSFSGGSTLINERGLEGIITPEGTITSLPAKSGILPADLTKNLWALGEVAPNLITQLSGKSFNRIDEKRSEDNSMHVGTLNATFNTDAGFDAAAFWNSVKSQISLTKNNH